MNPTCDYETLRLLIHTHCQKGKSSMFHITIERKLCGKKRLAFYQTLASLREQRLSDEQIIKKLQERHPTLLSLTSYKKVADDISKGITLADALSPYLSQPDYDVLKSFEDSNQQHTITRNYVTLLQSHELTQAENKKKNALCLTSGVAKFTLCLYALRLIRRALKQSQ